ncbi:NAD(+) synthase [Cellulosilyticum ruminicola]|uniref:NAD(+) synthase n=1 Tax=Cellulosilyticum ruminicola TaxID=425254 RepID=UPI0006D24438|nr:NAD(+) synthase [Cellulosilyticum ruminicola]
MDYHFLKVCAATPSLQVTDCHYNVEQILNCIAQSTSEGASVVLFPELCMTGYTCSDLFLQTTLLEECENAVVQLLEATKINEQLIIIGAPITHYNHLYNVAMVIHKGKILGMVPKSYLPNYSEFYEKRWFNSGLDMQLQYTNYAGQKQVPISSQLLFKATNIPYFKLGIEICEDLWTMLPPSTLHALNGTTLIVNPSASNEIVGKNQYRHELLAQQSAKTMSAYIYTSSSVDESTTDVVFSGHKLIYENGYCISESELFPRENDLLYGIIDLERLQKERIKQNHTHSDAILNALNYKTIEFELQTSDFEFNRFVDPKPFVPNDEAMRKERCKHIFDIQAHGLAHRMAHTKAQTFVLGISGGLDSTLALLVCVKAAKILGKPLTSIVGVTMPGFGTTDRTYNNAINLMKLLGVTVREISIVESAKQHLKDIGHDLTTHDVTYENAQARERTQILMDLSNQTNGLVIGTGDLSELALGWATYNGDHMSMYAVNASIPKTLVRYLIDYVAHFESEPLVQEILIDVLETPVSPELLPPDSEGKIAQKTEDLVGPYELHDFYLYHMIRFGYRPTKIYFLAQVAFKDVYDNATILKWLKTFYRRFFNQQFKRSCLPDGPKVGSICVSPRGDWRMPSDTCSRIWLDEIEKLEA